LSPGGTGPDGYIGHIITFVHRGPETLLTTLPHVDSFIIESSIIINISDTSSLIAY
jgi:hypothetical protein